MNKNSVNQTVTTFMAAVHITYHLFYFACCSLYLRCGEMCCPCLFKQTGGVQTVREVRVVKYYFFLLRYVPKILKRSI